MIIEFKDDEVMQACFKNAWHTKLIDVLLSLRKIIKKVIITEGWRMAYAGDVHCTNPLRAIDLRSRNFKDPGYIALNINLEWEYDPQRPEKQVAWYHDSGQGFHFHVQVHPRTRQRV